MSLPTITTTSCKFLSVILKLLLVQKRQALIPFPRTGKRASRAPVRRVAENDEFPRSYNPLGQYYLGKVTLLN